MKLRIATILTILLAFSLPFVALAQRPGGTGHPGGTGRPDGIGRPGGTGHPVGRPGGGRPGRT